jgi:hypothetical protein
MMLEIEIKMGKTLFDYRELWFISAIGQLRMDESFLILDILAHFRHLRHLYLVSVIVTGGVR